MATDDAAASGGKKKGILLLVLLLLIAIGAGVGGVTVAKSMLQSAQGGQPTTQPAGEAGPAKPASAGGEEFGYYNLPQITVNLDEPRMSRYIRLTVTLAFRQEDLAAATKALDLRKEELPNMLTEHLVGCTLEDVRGKQNFNRLQREIQDKINQRLWNDKPMIHHVVFKEFAVQ